MSFLFFDTTVGFPSREPIKPWPQLRQAVKNSHRRFSEIACKVPFLFNWREDPLNSRLRVYFLSSINISSDITLIYYDIDTDPNAKPVPDFSHDVHQIEANLNREVVINERTVVSSNEVLATGSSSSTTTSANSSSEADEEFMQMSGRRLNYRKMSESRSGPQWRPLIITTDNELNSSSREENLQLERKRIMFSGITSYEYQQKTNRFVFTSGENLYWFDDPLDTPSKRNGPNGGMGPAFGSQQSAPPYLPNKLESTTSFTKINPQLCPSDENLVAYVADGDLWVCNLKSRLEFRLTETKFESDSTVMSAGMPSYVLQEEFRRYTGFWWRPDNEFNHIDTSGDLSYTILCEFVDETEVDVVKIASWDGTVEEYRFPRPGL